MTDEIRDAYIDGIYDEKERVIEIIESYEATIHEAEGLINEYSLIGGYVTLKAVSVMLAKIKDEIQGDEKHDK